MEQKAARAEHARFSSPRRHQFSLLNDDADLNAPNWIEVDSGARFTADKCGCACPENAQIIVLLKNKFNTQL
jgi:hypothetical protein